jgi:hypothetical protein
MQLFMAAAADFTCELIEDELYLYPKRRLVVTDPDTLAYVAEVANRILPKLSRQAGRYSDAQVGNRAANLVAAPGRRLRRKMLSPFWTVVVLALFAYGLFAISSGFIGKR